MTWRHWRWALATIVSCIVGVAVYFWPVRNPYLAISIDANTWVIVAFLKKRIQTMKTTIANSLILFATLLGVGTSNLLRSLHIAIGYLAL
ncbi:hypothetical protein [Alicyclobacillus fastidiosus]|uniref:hypothetical protein n=1 Tax=Alicyclobacillus fastidiosus TaxID=392011 RepID=UPI0023E9A9E2|nr:hypothetical protein [Alicyclobacillus fastidiosus]GMA62057.1 hypothetical protein GCM10025859_24970 [Alicyclobacillus fastidiosus]